MKVKIKPLEECLKGMKEEEIDDLYITSTQLLDEETKKMPTKDKILYLKKQILERFEEMMKKFNESEIKWLENLEEEKKKDEYLIALMHYGYYFLKDENTLLLPKELYDMWEEYKKTSEKHENDLTVANIIANFYVSTNGIMTLDSLFDLIIHKHLRNVTEKEIKKILDNSNISIYKDTYCMTVTTLNETKQEQRKRALEFLELKEDDAVSYYIPFPKIIRYYQFMNDIINQLIRIVSKRNEDICNFILNILFYSVDFEDFKNQTEELKEFLTNKKIQQVVDLVEENYDKFRRYCLNGRSEEEEEFEFYLENIKLKKEPEKQDLMSYLKELEDSSLALIQLNYDYNFDKNELKDAIIKRFQEQIEDEMIDSDLLMYQIENNAITEENLSLLENGFIFPYQKDDQTVYFLPEELKTMFKDFALIHFTMEQMHLIGQYISINGVIEKDKLLELLKENHDIELEEEILSLMIKELDASVYEDKYYSFVEDYDKNDIEQIIKIKNQYKDYKKIDASFEDYNETFVQALRSYMEDKNLLDTNQLKEFLNAFGYSSAINCLSKEVVTGILQDFKIKESNQKEIVKIVKKYKNDIPIFWYNGYSIKEHNEKKEKKIKIGRNDPCPCGSGKKYKKCCGRV